MTTSVYLCQLVCRDFCPDEDKFHATNSGELKLMSDLPCVHLKTDLIFHGYPYQMKEGVQNDYSKPTYSEPQEKGLYLLRIP